MERIQINSLLNKLYNQNKINKIKYKQYIENNMIVYS